MTRRRYQVEDGHPLQCSQPRCDWIRTTINPIPLCSKHRAQYLKGNLGIDPEARLHHDDPTWLPEDGILDEIAVSIAAVGIRVVRLTTRERFEATKRILANGGNAGTIMHRLGVGVARANRLRDKVHREEKRNNSQAA